MLEETVWTVVHGLLSDPQRLLRQHKVQLERERRQMRGDPDREVRDIAGQLQKLELERKGYQRLAARGSMGDDELDAALAELDGQRNELQKALSEAQQRQNVLWRPRENLANLNFILLQMDRMRLNQASPEDRRRVYQALRLQATVDREGKIRLNGIFDPDVYLPGMLRDAPTDPNKPRPRVPKGTKVQVITPCAKCVATSDTRR